METLKRYENYPVCTVLLTSLFSITLYGLGFVIIMRTGLIFSVFYLIYVLLLEYRVMRHHCTNCFYWGRTCGFGKGRLSSIFFKKGDTAQFCNKDMSWKDMIPDFLVSLIPVVVGIVLLILKFDLVLLSAVVVIMLLTTVGNGFIRGVLTCRYCRQRDSGCPAEKLFNKK